MNYLIDYDTLQVECKSADRDALEKYIKDNGLELAVTVIAEEDDFLMEMSFEEVAGLFNNISSRERKFENDEEAAEVTYALLQGKANEFQDFTPALGKKLLKAGDKRSKDAPSKAGQTAKPTGKPAVKSSSGAEKKPVKRKRKKSYTGSTFTVGMEEPMKGRHTRMVNFIEENMGEATGEELESFLESEGTAPAEHISFAIRKGYIVEAEL